MQISVFIVSNVRLHRDGLVALLRGCPSIEVLGADSVQETQNVLRTTATNVALIDAPSPSDSDLSGRFEKSVRGCEFWRSGFARQRVRWWPVRPPASTVTCRWTPRWAIWSAAIENVVRGELTCSPKVAASLYQCIGSSRTAAVSALTTRELQVAELMNRGCPTKEIAWRLGVQPALRRTTSGTFCTSFRCIGAARRWPSCGL